MNGTILTAILLLLRYISNKSPDLTGSNWDYLSVAPRSARFAIAFSGAYVQAMLNPIEPPAGGCAPLCRRHALHFWQCENNENSPRALCLDRMLFRLMGLDVLGGGDNCAQYDQAESNQ